MNSNGQPRIDYTQKDYASLREALMRLAREKLPAWTDQSPNDLGMVLLELFAYLGDHLFYYQDRIANESYLETAVERRSVLHLLRLIGYELRPPQPASADLILRFTEDTTAATIATGTTFATSSEVAGGKLTFCYLGATLEQAALKPIKLANNEIRSNCLKLPVVQVNAPQYEDQTVGSSDGSAGQRFALAHTPLIESTLQLTIEESGVHSAWERRPHLLASRAGDNHYSVQRDERDVAYLCFGDGKYGRIPPRGRNNIVASYYVGGGAKGNVPPRTITKAVTTLTGLVELFNEAAASGGADAEVIGEAAQRAPRLFRARGRAVTAEDYEAHARAFGVGKVRAHAINWNRIELVVAPAGGGYPSDTLKTDLRAYFEDKRMLTTLVEIADPVYVPVFIKGTLEVESHYFSNEIVQRAQQAVRGLLAFDNVRFGDKLYLSKVYEAIESIQGVRGVNVTDFARDKLGTTLSARVPGPLGVPGGDQISVGAFSPGLAGLASTSTRLPENGTLEFDWNEIPVAHYTGGIELAATGGRRAY